MNTFNTKKQTRTTLLGSNPVLRRLSLICDQTRADSNAATYSGIFAKTAYFLLITMIGILLYSWLENNVFCLGGYTLQLNSGEDGAREISYVHLAVPEILIGLGCMVTTVVMPFICAASVAATPVCGTLYCLGEGYLISLILFKFLGMRNIPTSVGLVALILTVLVVAVMAFLYTARIVKAGKKFYTILFTACGALILGSIVSVILYLIPFTRQLVSGLMSSPVIGIISALISVILASMFLISDFAVIENCVNDQLPKRYEWMASFGLAFTVIWLYLKILELLIRILGKGKSSN